MQQDKLRQSFLNREFPPGCSYYSETLSLRQFLLDESVSVCLGGRGLYSNGSIWVYPWMSAEVGQTSSYSRRITFIFFHFLYDRQDAGQLWKGGKLTNQKAATC